jgi:hydroxypyruvate isomerase
MNHEHKPVSRRTLLATGAILAVGANVSARGADAAARQDVPPEDYKVKNGRIRQSVMGWCFNPMKAPELARHCKKMGIVGIEGIGKEHYPAVREIGLEVSLVSSHGFKQGPVNPANHEFCEKSLRDGIDLAVAVNCKRVITFTGMREKTIDDEASAKNCVDLWKRVIGYAEQKKIDLCLEHLNSRDDTHPMKGHPGYFGDHVDFCVELIRRVGSPNMKLLFDIYHVQIMDGDVIRRIRKYNDVIGHVHTAGVPGRGELTEDQEVNYPAVMRALLEIGFTGYVAQEFIPTWDDKIAALRHAVRLCDV